MKMYTCMLSLSFSLSLLSFSIPNQIGPWVRLMRNLRPRQIKRRHSDCHIRFFPHTNWFSIVENLSPSWRLSIFHWLLAWSRCWGTWKALPTPITLRQVIYDRYWNCMYNKLLYSYQNISIGLEISRSRSLYREEQIRLLMSISIILVDFLNEIWEECFMKILAVINIKRAPF